MRKLVVRLDEPINSPANIKAVSEMFTKIARDHGLEAKGMRWDYSQAFSLMFPYIIDRLMGWHAYPSTLINPRLILRLSNRSGPLVELCQQVHRLRKKSTPP